MDKPATKKDIDEVIDVIRDFMQHVDNRFNSMEAEQKKTREDISSIFNHLDSFLKQHEIGKDERLVMGHQLDRLNKWTHELAEKIGHKLTV